jgi:hypothetical protein
MTIITMFLFTSLALTACAAQQPENQEEEGIKTIYVGPQLVDCVGVAPQQCLLVKEDPQAEYTLFYDPTHKRSTPSFMIRLKGLIMRQGMSMNYGSKKRWLRIHRPMVPQSSGPWLRK